MCNGCVCPQPKKAYLSSSCTADLQRLIDASEGNPIAEASIKQVVTQHQQDFEAAKRYISRHQKSQKIVIRLTKKKAETLRAQIPEGATMETVQHLVQAWASSNDVCPLAAVKYVERLLKKRTSKTAHAEAGTATEGAGGGKCHSKVTCALLVLVFNFALATYSSGSRKEWYHIKYT